MKPYRFVLCACTLILSAFTTTIPAQSGYDRLNAPTADGSPTLQVTSDWLAQTLQIYGGDAENDSYLYEYSNISIDNNCVFRWTEKSTFKDPGNSRNHGSYQISTSGVPLGAVTKLEIGTNGNVPVSINFYTGQIVAIQVSGSPTYGANGKKQYGNQGVSNVNTTYVYIARSAPMQAGGEVPPTPAQIVPRVLAALQHAVTLCAGSYQTPTQSNQPF